MYWQYKSLQITQKTFQCPSRALSQCVTHSISLLACPTISAADATEAGRYSGRDYSRAKCLCAIYCCSIDTRYHVTMLSLCRSRSNRSLSVLHDLLFVSRKWNVYSEPTTNGRCEVSSLLRVESWTQGAPDNTCDSRAVVLYFCSLFSLRQFSLLSGCNIFYCIIKTAIITTSASWSNIFPRKFLNKTFFIMFWREKK